MQRSLLDTEPWSRAKRLKRLAQTVDQLQCEGQFLNIRLRFSLGLSWIAIRHTPGRPFPQRCQERPDSREVSQNNLCEHIEVMRLAKIDGCVNEKALQQLFRGLLSMKRPRVTRRGLKIQARLGDTLV
jgi:hypothetical protein